MRITVKFFASCAEAMGTREMRMSMDAGTTVRLLTGDLAVRHPELSPFLPSLAVAINGEIARPDDRITDGDEVALLPPVSGG